MTNKSDKHKQEKSKLSPIIAGMAGAAAGAITVSLMDKDKRKKAGEAAKKTFDKAKDKAQELKQKAKSELNKAADEADDKVDDLKKKADRKIDKNASKARNMN